MFFSLKKGVVLGIILLSFCVNAKTQISELTVADIVAGLDEAILSRDVYENDAPVRDGYKPSSSFLESSQVEKGFTLEDGSVVFRFIQNAGLANALYVYNPANGMISAYKDDPLRLGTEFWPEEIREEVAPNFAAQVLEKDGRITVVFRGSKTLSDWKENGSQLLGNITPQFQLADFLVQSIQETTDQHIHLTGHSEGGGEAQYAVLRSIERGENNISATTFNSQRLSKGVLGVFNSDTIIGAKNVIQNYRIGNDPVSGWEFLGEDLVGDTVNLPDACIFGDYLCYSYIDAHSIVTVIEAFKNLLKGCSGNSQDTREGGPFDLEPERDDSDVQNRRGKYQGLKPIKLF